MSHLNISIYVPVKYDHSSMTDIFNLIARVVNQSTDGSPEGRESRAAIPTGGTWKRGHILYDSAPSAGGTVGWICTASGTPGTWKTFGAIAA